MEGFPQGPLECSLQGPAEGPLQAPKDTHGERRSGVPILYYKPRNSISSLPIIVLMFGQLLLAGPQAPWFPLGPTWCPSSAQGKSLELGLELWDPPEPNWNTFASEMSVFL